MYRNNFPNTVRFLHRHPDAWAVIAGSPEYPMIQGTVRFYQTPYGVLTVAEVMGLPAPADPCESPVLGFHIHAGGSCTGTPDEPFADTGSHYDPLGCPHPFHAGDLPPLFGANGYAFLAFITDRFTVPELIGKTVVIHSQRDDFSTQPSGDSGIKIACGEIRK